MPEFDFTDPTSGRTIVVDVPGDVFPTEAELTQMFAQDLSVEAPAQAVAQEEAPPADANISLSQTAEQPVDFGAVSLVNPPTRTEQVVSALDQAIVGGTEAALSIGTGALAEIAGGLGVLGQVGKEAIFGDLDIFGEGAKSPESRAVGQRILKNLEGTREGLTFQPRSPEGKQALSAIGNVIEPIAKGIEAVETFIGKNVLDATGSPALAAVSEAIPSLATEMLTFKGSKALANKRNNRAERKLSDQIAESAPSAPELRDASSAIFDEIDNSGVVFKQAPVKQLSDQIVKMANDFKVDPQLTPKAFRAVARFAQDTARGDISVTELDRLRRVLAIGADSLDNDLERTISRQAIDMLDDFVESTDTSTLTFRPGETAAGVQGIVPRGGLPPKDLPPQPISVPGIDLGEKYKVARNLWGRAKRSEMMEELFEKARNQASGFENGLVVGFRGILNNPRKLKFFNDSEKSAMKAVVRGEGTDRNLYKFLGRAGGFEGLSTNFMGTVAGSFIGQKMFGTAGAIGVPMIGAVSKKMAQKLTIRGAQFADEVIRAGNDARAIARAYNRNTPRSQRNPKDLSQLFMRPDTNIAGLVGDDIAIEAAKIAAQNKNAIANALEAQAIIQANQANQER